MIAMIPAAPPRAHRLAQQDQRQDDRKHRRQLVDGSHPRHVPPRQRREVAQPRGAGRQPGQHQENQRAPINESDTGGCAGQRRHAPRPRDHHNRAQRRRDRRVRRRDPGLCQDGSQPCEQG